MSVCLHAPVAASHTRIDVSSEPDTTCTPSNWNVEKTSEELDNGLFERMSQLLDIPEVNIHDWCDPVGCANTLRSLDSTLSPCNRRRPTRLACHRIERSARPPNVQPVCASIGPAQCPKHAALHHVIRSPL